jgi:hypothetical protein
MGELRDLDRELAKTPSGPQNDAKAYMVFSHFNTLNTLEWLSFLINEKQLATRK